jgi:hypothetical protein
MDKLSKADVQRLQRDLYEHYVTLGRNKDRLEKRSWLKKPLSFWMESVRFLISDMQIWEEVGNPAKGEKAFKRAREAMYYVDRLMSDLTRD